MSIFNRLLVPDSLLGIVAPALLVNLMVQIANLIGWVPYDGEKAAYIFSLLYLVSVGVEAVGIWRERRVR